MKCTECGVDISDFDVTCPACGAVQTRTPAAVPATADASRLRDGENDIEEDPPSHQSRHKTFGFGSAVMWAIVVLALAGAAVIYVQTSHFNALTQAASQTASDTTQLAQLQAGEGACQTTLSYLERAAFAVNRLDYHSAITFSTSGLATNANCTESSSHVAYGGVLLSFKAIAEHDLQQGDPNGDMSAAVAMLMQCQNQPVDATDAADVRNCATELGSDRLYQQRWQDGGQ